MPESPVSQLPLDDLWQPSCATPKEILEGLFRLEQAIPAPPDNPAKLALGEMQVIFLVRAAKS